MSNPVSAYHAQAAGHEKVATKKCRQQVGPAEDFGLCRRAPSLVGQCPPRLAKKETVLKGQGETRRPFRTQEFVGRATRHWRVWLISSVAARQLLKPIQRRRTRNEPNYWLTEIKRSEDGGECQSTITPLPNLLHKETKATKRERQRVFFDLLVGFCLNRFIYG